MLNKCLLISTPSVFSIRLRVPEDRVIPSLYSPFPSWNGWVWFWSMNEWENNATQDITIQNPMGLFIQTRTAFHSPGQGGVEGSDRLWDGSREQRPLVLWASLSLCLAGVCAGTTWWPQCSCSILIVFLHCQGALVRPEKGSRSLEWAEMLCSACNQNFGPCSQCQMIMRTRFWE